ncbi:alpha/beta fold hydrolase [Sphaerisporangium rubeum]|uniref:Pimeloyl-ACP methyl ester carboxylesterase n=1 Tax=Sphaerisporangium rubeum TaxID=321317 RepID=A0A7X0M3Z7_9ACTN|nr:alpha/beta hydrolase [Sphaerisporangium rubeum]MBB6471168.1 pimeloyl-ACP methyl ester carboxylesterase [Sphaerisporangium rubeum]
MKTAKLDVPGAHLYYEIQGSGPVLLLIAGGNGDTAGFTALSRLLADRYTVVAYDPRGNSRSTLTEPPGPQTVETHAEDAHLLLTEVTEHPAYVFGSSSGALVGLDLITRHPGQVRTLVAHEPPAVTLLTDRDHWLTFLDAVRETYFTHGVDAAAAKFAGAMGQRPVMEPQGDLPPHVQEIITRIRRNFDFFFAHEVTTFPRYEPDLQALRTLPLIVAGGTASHHQMPYEAATSLATHLDLPLTPFPGDHVGYIPHAGAFAERLHEVLGGR